VNLGNAYHRGQGVPQDDREAIRLYRRAADQGDAAAQCQLGFSNEERSGVNNDVFEAVRWFRLSADQGYKEARFKIGVYY